MRRLLNWWRERKAERRRQDSWLNVMMYYAHTFGQDSPPPPYIKRGGAWLPPGVKRDG